MKKILSAFALLLALVASSNVVQADFSDVSEDYYYYTAINYVQSQGIVSGHPDGTYRPTDRIDRAAFTKIIIEAQFTDEEIESCGSADFLDVAEGVWYDKYVCVAQKNNVIDGYPDGSFGGEKLINLAEASKIIVEAFDYDVQPDTETWFKPYIFVLEQKHALPLTLTGFEHELTRGELAEMVYRLLADVNFKNSATFQGLSENRSFSSEELSYALIQDDVLFYFLDIDKYRNDIMAMYSSYLQFTNLDSLENNIENVELERIKTLENFLLMRGEALKIGPYDQNNVMLETLVALIDSRIDLFEGELKKVNDLFIKKSNGNLSVEEEKNFMVLLEELDKKIIDKILIAENGYIESNLEFIKVYGLHLTLALNYSDVLMDSYRDAIGSLDEHIAEFNLFEIGNDVSALEASRKKALQQAKEIKEGVQKISPFLSHSSYSDSKLLNATIDSMDMLIAALTEEGDLILLYGKHHDDPNTITWEAVEFDKKMRASFNQKRDTSIDTVNAAHNTFLKKY